MTVSCRVEERHRPTGIQISDHVRQELDLIGIKKLQLFSAHDGSGNMMKASRLLHVSDIQAEHCLAHALHLLLMTDEIGRSPEIQDLLNRC